MRWEERQKKVEERTYESIDHLAEELSLKVTQYPIVIWVGKKDVNELRLPKIHEKDINLVKTHKTSITYSKGLILVGKDDSRNITEESSHFLHFVNSGISKLNRHGYDEDCLDILTEALGFFGAKLLDPSVKNDALIANSDPYKKENGVVRNYIYMRGYTLGEIMFYEYIKGKIGKRFVKDLFQNPLDREGSAKRKLKQLESKFRRFQ